MPAQQGGSGAIVIAGERRADCFKTGAELQSNRHRHGCVTRDRFDRRAGLVRRQENLGNPAIGIAPGAKCEVEPGMAELERFA
jgi:hypothetical protein